MQYGITAQEKALAKLCDRDGVFNDEALLLEERKRMQNVMERAYEAGKVTEEWVLDRATALWRAYMWMGERGERKACFERAKGGVHAPTGGE